MSWAHVVGHSGDDLMDLCHHSTDQSYRCKSSVLKITRKSGFDIGSDKIFGLMGGNEFMMSETWCIVV